MPPACFEAANLIPIYIVVADLDTRYYVLDSSVSILDSEALLLIFKLKIIILRTQFSAICQNIVYCSTPEPASRQLPSLPQVCSLQSAVGSQQSPVYSAQFSQSSVFGLLLIRGHLQALRRRTLS